MAAVSRRRLRLPLSSAPRLGGGWAFIIHPSRARGRRGGVRVCLCWTYLPDCGVSVEGAEDGLPGVDLAGQTRVVPALALDGLEVVVEDAHEDGGLRGGEGGAATERL